LTNFEPAQPAIFHHFISRVGVEDGLNEILELLILSY
jgi:hypothetical protein